MKQPSEVEADSVPLAQIEAEQVKVMQRKLQESGYYHGEIDGKVGPQTRNALNRFYSDAAQLALRGRISPDSAEAFGVPAAEIERVRGEEPVQGKASLRGNEARGNEAEE
jgi:peptidoglycan hydrolase-like protein with peptidoglycan-binding domain